MLLIAITGEKGAGKSTLLARLIDWYRQEGRPVEGFTSEAGDRPVPGRGADWYDLRWAATGETRRFATRVPTGERIPYTLDEETQARTQVWAQALPAGCALVALDEFGKLEAEGGGHMAIWPAVEAARPGVVAIAVRREVLAQVSERLGRAFDLVVDAGEAEAWARLQAACLAERDWSRVGLYGAGSGTLEMTLGAMLHGAMLPVAGLVMASAQASVMTWAGAGLGARERVVWVPFIAAGLKALSPAGNRLRPMLAISVQGLLYAGATRLLGWNRPSVAIASALVGAWAAAQGLLLQYLLVGHELLKAYRAVVGWVEAHWGLSAPAIATAIAAWIALWALVAGTVGALAFGRQDGLTKLEAWRERVGGALPAWGERTAPRWDRALAEGARDLARPSFWVPLALVVAVILATGTRWEAAFWVVARAATVGMLLFTAVRLLDVRGALLALRRRGHWGPALALARAIEALDTGRSRP